MRISFKDTSGKSYHLTVATSVTLESEQGTARIGVMTTLDALIIRVKGDAKRIMIDHNGKSLL